MMERGTLSQIAQAKCVFVKVAHQNGEYPKQSIFASLCAYIKLEMLKMTTKVNHFALKSKLYMRALRTAFEALNEFQPVRLAA